MRILLVNPNTSESITARLAVTARAVAAPDTLIDPVTAPVGVPVIETPEQCAEAAPVVLRILDERAVEYDAVIIAAYGDPGLLDARTRIGRPVYGIAESSMLAAVERADRFSIITAGPALVDTLWQLAEGYGVREKLVDIRLLPWSLAEIAAAPETYLEAFVGACTEAMTQDRIGALVVGGGTLAGLARRLQSQLPLPVLDGVVCAVERCERGRA